MCKKRFTSKSVKCLRVLLDECLQQNFHINQLSMKLNKEKAMLCKIRQQANETTLRSIYYAIFQSHLSHVCTAWDQNIKYNHQIRILQRKAIRIIFFSDFNEHTTPPLSKAKILRFIGFIQMENCIFVKNLFQVLCTLYQTNLKKLFVSYHPQCKKIFIYKSPGRPVKRFFLPYSN